MNIRRYELIKRCYDLVLSVMALIMLAPLFLTIMILLRFSGEHEVFYIQKRLGYRCTLFHMYKFATMLKESYLMPGGWVTVTNDPRTTSIGKFLRKTKLNELPQLLNIIRGDMSIVGPRPTIESSFVDYPEDIKESIYTIKPGLTSLASIVLRNEEVLITKITAKGLDPVLYYNNVIYPFKGKLEDWYRENRSVWVDIKIISLTCIVIFSPNTSLVRRSFPSAPIDFIES
jgi:lipopolysaccharide/colanic/teichoic acid biosynthesis glycosyltransferase